MCLRPRVCSVKALTEFSKYCPAWPLSQKKKKIKVLCYPDEIHDTLSPILLPSAFFFAEHFTTSDKWCYWKHCRIKAISRWTWSMYTLGCRQIHTIGLAGNSNMIGLDSKCQPIGQIICVMMRIWEAVWGDACGCVCVCVFVPHIWVIPEQCPGCIALISVWVLVTCDSDVASLPWQGNP